MTNNWMKRPWVLGLAVCAVTVASYAQWSNPADDIPAYHPSAPLNLSALPPILSGKQLTGEHFRYPWQVHCYQQAIKISSVIYHCAKEGFFAYQQTKLGKTPAQIRAAIIRHEYESIDLEKQ
jgi:hypothetical protein